MNDPARAFLDLPLVQPAARGGALDVLLRAHAAIVVPVAESALLSPPAPPPNIDPGAYQHVLDGIAITLLRMAGPHGLAALVRVAEQRPSVDVVCELGRIMHERPHDRVPAAEAIAPALARLDPAEVVTAANLMGAFDAADLDARIEAALDAIVRARPDLGVHLLHRWARAYGVAPIARNRETLLAVVREGLLPIPTGSFVVYAVGMRSSASDAPVLGEFIAAELLLALDPHDGETRAWLERQAAGHPDPDLAARASRILASSDDG